MLLDSQGHGGEVIQRESEVMGILGCCRNAACEQEKGEKRKKKEEEREDGKKERGRRGKERGRGLSWLLPSFFPLIWSMSCLPRPHPAGSQSVGNRNPANVVCREE